MEYNMERWYNATNQRFSVRSYKSAPGGEEMAALSEAAQRMSTRGVRIVIGELAEAFKPSLPLFPKAVGTHCFAAFIANKQTDLSSVGYLGEAFILEATAAGVGTCWMGASYNKGAVRRTLELAEGEFVSCVTPLGVAAEPYAGRPRKDLKKLTGLTQEQLQALPEWQQQALSCARLAPSAMNRQPWEFDAPENGLIVRCTSGNFGYGRLDCGIAMLHMELGAAHGGVSGEWEISENEMRFTANPE